MQRTTEDSGPAPLRGDSLPRTSFRTEVRWLFGVVFVATLIAVAGAFYFLWQLVQGGAGC
ncbi:MAG: hypothetical protein IT456_10955 [Planctomycetes bacterium]|nr:hypothetical protein [Planctomycetota bacterium]